jgi:hypothetical protein
LKIAKSVNLVPFSNNFFGSKMGPFENQSIESTRKLGMLGKIEKEKRPSKYTLSWTTSCILNFFPPKAHFFYLCALF